MSADLVEPTSPMETEVVKPKYVMSPQFSLRPLRSTDISAKPTPAPKPHANVRTVLRVRSLNDEVLDEPQTRSH